MMSDKEISDSESDDDSKSQTILNSEPDYESVEDDNFQNEGSSNEDEEQTETPKKIKKSKIKGKQDNQRTIFVGNLPHTVEKKHLLKLFLPFGKIDTINFGVSSKEKSFRKRKQKTNRGQIIKTAYIRFSDVNSTNSALSLDGKLVKGNTIRVDLVSPTKFSKHKGVFLVNLPSDMTENQLREMFEGCGELNSVRLIRDKKTLLCKGIGFINFKNHVSVINALQMNKHEFKNSKIKVAEIDYNWNKKKKTSLKHAEEVNAHINLKPINQKVKGGRKITKGTNKEKLSKQKANSKQNKRRAMIKAILNKPYKNI